MLAIFEWIKDSRRRSDLRRAVNRQPSYRAGDCWVGACTQSAWELMLMQNSQYFSRWTAEAAAFLQVNCRSCMLKNEHTRTELAPERTHAKSNSNFLKTHRLKLSSSAKWSSSKKKTSMKNHEKSKSSRFSMKVWPPPRIFTSLRNPYIP